jgi:YHS domain-containing protein
MASIIMRATPTPKSRIMKCVSLAASLIMTFLAAGCAERAPATSRQPVTTASAAKNSPAATAAASMVADRSLVCMVNNQFMGSVQIPVEVDGRTYYGCCDMCKGRLEQDVAARTATDPVSKRPVDKSLAVIARNDRGAVLYFESEENLAAYTRAAGR